VTLNSGLLQCIACTVSGAESIYLDPGNLEMKVTCFFKMLVTTYPVTGITYRWPESLISVLRKPRNWCIYDHYIHNYYSSKLTSVFYQPATHPHYLFLSCSIHTLPVGHTVVWWSASKWQIGVTFLCLLLSVWPTDSSELRLALHNEQEL
jgi:hypothetical protein